jgi:hypothetical protein
VYLFMQLFRGSPGTKRAILNGKALRNHRYVTDKYGDISHLRTILEHRFGRIYGFFSLFAAARLSEGGHRRGWSTRLYSDLVGTPAHRNSAAMNGPQLSMDHSDSLKLMNGPPALRWRDDFRVN